MQILSKSQFFSEIKASKEFKAVEKYVGNVDNSLNYFALIILCNLIFTDFLLKSSLKKVSF